MQKFNRAVEEALEVQDRRAGRVPKTSHQPPGALWDMRADFWCMLDMHVCIWLGCPAFGASKHGLPCTVHFLPASRSSWCRSICH